VVVYKTLPHYRVDFYEGLRAQLAVDGIRFRLIVGQPDPEMAARNDTASLPWAETVRNRYFRLGTRSIVWQPCLRALRTADLVIVEQASKLLVNYLLLAWRRIGGPKVAWWGHGLNLDVDAASPLGEAIKRRFIRSPDWWFCYTEGTKRLVCKLGVDGDQTTVVQNAIDVSGLRATRAGLTDADLALTRQKLGIQSEHVAVALGSIYPTKRPEFLLSVADELRQALPDFHLLVIGDGPRRAYLDSASETRSWLHVVGMQRGADLVRFAALGKVVLNPGLVGLAVLDAFAIEMPMVTCELPYHSPEIEYLEDGFNGLVLGREASAADFASAVAGVLTDSVVRNRLKEGCVQSANRYSVAAMTSNFAAGVRTALRVSSGGTE
jgi:glycosyltransferase involved in cell wall biosynthesis